jgi:hypothetical protein
MAQSTAVLSAIERPLNPGDVADAPLPQRIGPRGKYADPPEYFADSLEDAERLLKYAAETGVHGEFLKSCGDWSLIQASTMRLPPIGIKL